MIRQSALSARSLFFNNQWYCPQSLLFIGNQSDQFRQPIKTLSPKTFFADAKLGIEYMPYDGALGADDDCKKFVVCGVFLHLHDAQRLVQRKLSGIGKA